MKNMIQEKMKNILGLVMESLDMAFARAFADVAEKKIRGFLLLVLVVIIFWQLGLNASLNWVLFLAFLFYGWENRILAFGALLYLASCPILLSLQKDALAESMAVQAYYFLVMTVVLQMVEFKREQWIEKPAGKINLIMMQIEMRCREVATYCHPFASKIASYLKDKAVNFESRFQILIRAGKLKLKFDKNILIFLGLAVLILWKMLLPGYVLALDMIFAPDMRVVHSADKFMNFLPLSYLIAWLSMLIPAWLVQKIILVGLFFAIGFGAFKFLPVGESKIARYFSALIFLLNPFVYSRMVAGQWTVLAGYALLPLLLHFLLVFQKKKNFASAWKLLGTLFLISVFSNHFFLMSSILLAVWFLVSSLVGIVQKNIRQVGLMWKNILVAGIVFLVASSYWLVPALQRQAPLEQRFGTAHWEYFAAGGYKNIDPLLNLVSLNGFWGERNVWAKSFTWPQDYTTFWIASSLIALLIILGIVTGLRSKENRSKTIIFSVIGFCALVFSAGIGDTIFRNFNLWFFENVPLWTGFRDSQKFSGFLALSYATLAGLGLSYIIDFLDRRNFSFKDLTYPLFFLVPFFLGFLMWGGFHGQLKPVQYPMAWFDAKDIMDADATNSQTLFLPWHGYMSFRFNGNLVVANPARRFFGEKTIVSRNVEVGGIYDQESDSEYKKLDQMIRDNADSAETVDYLLERNVKYIVFFQDLAGGDYLKYDFLQSDRIRVVLKSGALIMYEIGE